MVNPQVSVITNQSDQFYEGMTDAKLFPGVNRWDAAHKDNPTRGHIYHSNKQWQKLGQWYKGYHVGQAIYGRHFDQATYSRVWFDNREQFKRFLGDYWKIHTPRGYCNLCGKKLSGRRTAWCSSSCRWEAYKIAGDVNNIQWLRRAILRRDEYCCIGCGVGFVKEVASKKVGTIIMPDISTYEMHHIIPIHDGGTNHPDNLVTLCRTCHLGAHHGKK